MAVGCIKIADVRRHKIIRHNLIFFCPFNAFHTLSEGNCMSNGNIRIVSPIAECWRNTYVLWAKPAKYNTHDSHTHGEYFFINIAYGNAVRHPMANINQ